MKMPKWVFENETSNNTFNQDIEEKFRHHKAMIQDDTEHLLHILWSDEKDPKRNAINYILDKDNGVFIIYGMFGTGIASWHHPLPIRVLLDSFSIWKAIEICVRHGGHGIKQKPKRDY